ncbi:uncharacterized protein FOBCDRAFT_281845 [Fusarium oxysporum Fo47]|uniref:Uncharacterized protein n=1 Tax=Fusarium oxysporum Fo47 TaxID=660027 RepID=W9JGI5_FUSOX|nr:uncharacterized protein FOBCDRAFT_281845 [Fusarium oxysporum Fo47]EWZ28750.1 hypothetical protein FOZG_17618 [Fusarium oxysporum Fo47]WJG37201.1 hypothetical protein FOBCDRAFT_281845 [Fusarium oxysporum Fo47]
MSLISARIFTSTAGKHNATEYLESFPFVIGCQGGPSDDPPFSVAGVIAIWRDAKDFGFMPLVGDFTQGDEIEVDDDILDQIMKVPRRLSRPPIITLLSSKLLL